MEPETVAVPKEVDVAVDKAEAVAQQIEITDEASLQQATDSLGIITVAKRNAEAARLALTGPLNKHIKFINDTFHPKKSVLELAERTIKRKIAAYHEEQARKAREAQARLDAERDIEEEATMVEQPPPPVVQAPATTVRTPGGVATSISRRWTFETVDLSKVPREYLVLDSAAVRRAIAAGSREIDGLRVFQTTDVSVR